MMTTNTKRAWVVMAVLAAGATFGWAASRLAMRGGAETRPFTVSVDEPAAGSLTPTRALGGASAAQPARRTPAVTTASRLTLPAGTPLSVAVNHSLSTQTAAPGQAWSGVVREDVWSHGRVAIPAGSPVSGTIAVAEPAERGDRARLQLAMTSVRVGGRSYSISGRSEMIEAGSTRARNLGAIAAGTAAGALIGKATSGSSRGTVVGGLIGGAAATAGVAASKGYQVVIPSGAELTFHTRSSVSLRA